MKKTLPSLPRWRLDLAGPWDGRLVLNPDLDVAAPPKIERTFHLPLPWNVQIEDLRWPGPEQELSGIVRPVQNQNFRDIQRKFAEGTVILTRAMHCQPPPGHRLFLVFEGSNYHTSVTLNGHALGTHDGGHLAFEFEVTEWIVPGEENTFEVTVDNLRRRDAAPQEQFNWQNYGGVYRPFYLEARPQTFIRNLQVSPGQDEAGWFADLSLRLDKAKAGTLDVHIRSGDQEETLTIPLDQAVWKGRIRMKSTPLVWVIGAGGISTCAVRFSPTDGAPDEVVAAFGFRTVDIDGHAIRINGKPVTIQGAAMHEQHPVFGNAVPSWQSVRDIRLMKQCGFNTVRAAHYPHAQSFYETCDREGMLCLAEVPCWQFNGHHFSSDAVARLCQNIAASMVEQLGNHPSIIAWIVQNESKSFEPGACAFFSDIARVFKDNDRTRFTISADNPTPPEHLAVVKHVKGFPSGDPPPTAACVDVLGINNYAGWYEEKSDYLPLTLDHIHGKLPQKPLLVTEFGAEGILGQRNLAMHPWTEDYQAELICRHIREIQSRPWMAGFILWLFIDYECASIGIRGINAKGLVDEFRRPKLAFNAVRHLLLKE